MDPARWLVDNMDLLPPGGRVLDVAAGRGRHALWLARHGYVVHAVDRNTEALEELRAAAAGLPITTEGIDLERDGATLGREAYDGVIVFNYLYRPLMPAVVDALVPGGVLLYETFTIGQAARGHPRNPAFLLHPGELLRLVEPLAIVRSREGDFERKLLASVAAKKVSASAAR